MTFPKWATTVTPFSKVLALSIFIAFPIIGFVLGIQYQILISTSLNQKRQNIQTTITSNMQRSSSTANQSTKSSDLELNKFIPLDPPYLVYFSGEINLDKNRNPLVKLDPFFFNTGKDYSSEKISDEAQYKVVLKKQSIIISEQKIDAYVCTDGGDYCGPNSENIDHSHGAFGVDSQVKFNLTELPDEIIFYYKDRIIYSIKEPIYPFPGIIIAKKTNKDGKINIDLNVIEKQDLHYNAIIYGKKNSVGNLKDDSVIISIYEGLLGSDFKSVIKNNSISYDYGDRITTDFKVVIYATDGFRTRFTTINKFD